MKTLTGLFATLSALFVATALACPCGAWSGVTITEIQAYTVEGSPPNGIIYVTLSGNGTTHASCATAGHNVVVLDASPPSGNIAAAMAINLRVSGASVTVGGTGTCYSGSGYEMVSSLGW